jgi:hypothetical protein
MGERGWGRAEKTTAKSVFLFIYIFFTMQVKGE